MTTDTLTIDGDLYLSGTIIAPSAETYTIFEQVTPAIRWKDGTLQQQWHVVERRDWVLGRDKERFEWRDVPVEG